MSATKISGKVFSCEETEKKTQGYQVRWTPRPGGWWWAELQSPDGRIQKIRLALHQKQNRFWSQIQGRPFHGEWLEEILEGSTARALGSADSDLMAQFPGKIRKILAQVGDHVAKGDALLLVEAMKMEFSIKAPFAGTVQKLHVHEGQQIHPGDRFFDLKGEE